MFIFLYFDSDYVFTETDSGSSWYKIPIQFLFSCHQILSDPKAMFTLYRIGFCSVSKVAPIQCEQELMFCCGAEVVPKRSQCEHKPYPSYNLQYSLLI